jgi:hypothetical protein
MTWNPISLRYWGTPPAGFASFVEAPTVPMVVERIRISLRSAIWPSSIACPPVCFFVNLCLINH